MEGSEDAIPRIALGSEIAGFNVDFELASGDREP
jgi:hypothetical protein